MRSHFCTFCHFCGTLVSHADSFYCPTVIGFAASLVEEIKEIKEILLPSLCKVLSAISAGHYYLMHIVFYCPTEIKEIKEIFVPTRESFLLFLLFLRDIIISCT